VTYKLKSSPDVRPRVPVGVVRFSTNV